MRNDAISVAEALGLKPQGVLLSPGPKTPNDAGIRLALLAAAPAQVGAALTAMRMRGETLGEIVACARAMRQAAIRIAPPYPILDVCGGPPSSSSPRRGGRHRGVPLHGRGQADDGGEPFGGWRVDGGIGRLTSDAAWRHHGTVRPLRSR